MTKIALAATAFLIAAGSALAGSDHYGSENANPRAAFVDKTFTASIRNRNMGKHVIIDPRNAVLPTGQSWPEVGQGIWGN
ncbi:DUF680 domain-containing protein [Bradyrhizobium sp. Arg314]